MDDLMRLAERLRQFGADNAHRYEGGEGDRVIWQAALALERIARASQEHE